MLSSFVTICCLLAHVLSGRGPKVLNAGRKQRLASINLTDWPAQPINKEQESNAYSSLFTAKVMVLLVLYITTFVFV